MGWLVQLDLPYFGRSVVLTLGVTIHLFNIHHPSASDRCVSGRTIADRGHRQLRYRIAPSPTQRAQRTTDRQERQVELVLDVGDKLCFVLNHLGLIVTWDCDTANVYDGSTLQHLVDQFQRAFEYSKFKGLLCLMAPFWSQVDPLCSRSETKSDALVPRSIIFKWVCSN
jgi:hypothetical protein